MTLAGRRGAAGDGDAAADDAMATPASGLPDGPWPQETLVASYDPRAVALLRDAVRQAFPETIVHVTAAPEPARLLLPALRPALVLLDLNFMEPSPGGLMAAAQAANPRARAVVVAGHGDDDRILPALRRGAAGIVVKYDTPEVIAEQLRNAAADVLPLTPALARQAIRHADAGGPGTALSTSEWELLAWVAAGDTLAQVAERTHQEPGEIQLHVDRIYRRMALRGRSVPGSGNAERAAAGPDRG